MSGRIRSVKPEWLLDERMALASSEARVLSIALILLADDYGNGRAGRIQLAGQVFPGKPLETLAKALEELATWFVTLYEVDGQHYFSIRGWAKHQKVDKPGKPRVPLPSEALEKVPESVENVRASRGSRSLPDPVPDLGPDPERVEPPVAPPPANDSIPPQPAEVPLQERALAWLEEPMRAALVHPSPETWPELVELEAHRATVFPGASRPLKGPAYDKRTRTLLERFAAGETPLELRNAVSGAALDDHYQRNPQHQTLATILKDSANVERFCRLLEQGGSRPRVNTGVRELSEGDAREERRRTRNNLIDDAKAGRYGGKYRAWAESGERPRELADELERLPRRPGAGDFNAALKGAPHVG